MNISMERVKEIAEELDIDEDTVINVLAYVNILVESG